MFFDPVRTKTIYNVPYFAFPFLDSPGIERLETKTKLSVVVGHDI